jgi:centromeric protein E
MAEPDEPPYEEEELAEPDHISVWVRVRPLSAAEADFRINWKLVDARTIQQVSPQTGVVLPGSGNTFKFDEVFNNDIGNEEVYEVAARDVVLRVLEGYNGTVLAYGQTSSGKTHTMIGTGDEPGVIPRAVSDIFANSTNIPGGQS